MGRGEEPGGLAFWEFLSVTKDIFTLAASAYTATNYSAVLQVILSMHKIVSFSLRDMVIHMTVKHA